MIAILINSLTGGGAERIALNLLQGLNDSGEKTLLICLEKELTYPIPSNQEVIFLTDYQKLRNPIFKVFIAIISAYKLRQIVRSRNISLVQSHLIRSNVINNLAKMFGSPHKSQIVSHGSLHLDSPKINRIFKRFLFRSTYRRSDQLISISKLMKHTQEEELHLSALPLNHIVIPNPHNIGEIIEQAKKPVDNFEFKQEITYLVSVGRLTRLKKVDTTLEAVAILRNEGYNLEFIIIGDGDDRSFYEEVTHKLDLDDYVHFIGQISNPFAYLAKADTMVLSSAEEGLPNVIIESLASGTPVISSDCVSGPREILHPNSDYMFQLTDDVEVGQYGILYPVNRLDLLVNSIKLILQDEDLRNRLTKDGLKHALCYRKDKIISKYISNIEEILSN